MKRLILALGVLIVVCSCNTDYIEHKVCLKNNLGELSICLPPEFDTTYCWTNYSDNQCSDLEMFRFANKKYSLLREDGDWYHVRPDSLYQLTIEQPKNIEECRDTVRFDKEYLEFIEESIRDMNPGNPGILTVEIRTIQKRNFIVIEQKFQTEKNCKFTLKLVPEIRGHYIVVIKFACQSKDCTNFIDRIEKSLNSIKITEHEQIDAERN